MANNLMVSTAM